MSNETTMDSGIAVSLTKLSKLAYRESTPAVIEAIEYHLDYYWVKNDLTRPIPENLTYPGPYLQEWVEARR